jgi:hypothetical protein
MYNTLRISNLSLHRVVVIRLACPCVVLPCAMRRYANCGGVGPRMMLFFVARALC